MRRRVQFGASTATSTARRANDSHQADVPCATPPGDLGGTDIADPGLVVGRRQGCRRSGCGEGRSGHRAPRGQERIIPVFRFDTGYRASVQSRGPGNFGVGTWIERRARSAPHRPALITADGVQTYAALAKRIRRLAGAFQRMGVGHGDRIAWLGENHPAFLEAFFAAGRIGAVLAPVNHYLAADERALVVADADPLIVLEHAALPETVFAPSVLHRIAVGGSRAGALDYESLFSERGAHDSDVAVDLDDLLFLPHTTGTTGLPKGVMLTHANVTWNVINFLTSAEFRNDDVTIAFAPFFRVGGTGVNVLPVLFMGGTVVVPEDVNPTGRSPSSSDTGSPSASRALSSSKSSRRRRAGRARTSPACASCSRAAPRCPTAWFTCTPNGACHSCRATACRRRGRLRCCSTNRAPSGRSARRACHLRSWMCELSMPRAGTSRPVRPASCTFAART